MALALNWMVACIISYLPGVDKTGVLAIPLETSPNCHILSASPHFFPDGPTAPALIYRGSLPLAHKGEDVLVHFVLVRVAEESARRSAEPPGWLASGALANSLISCRAEDDIRGALAPYPKHRTEQNRIE